MPRSHPLTTADRDAALADFIECHSSLLDMKNDLLAHPDEGSERKTIAEGFLAALVSIFDIPLLFISVLTSVSFSQKGASIIIDRMANFPAGGWGLGKYDDFVDWARELQDLPSTATTRSIQSLLRKLSAKLYEVTEPVEQDQEPSDDELPPAPDATPAPQIKSKPKLEPPPGSFVIIDCPTSVRFLFLCYSSYC
jgi:hypothetical protein